LIKAQALGRNQLIFSWAKWS